MILGGSLFGRGVSFNVDGLLCGESVFSIYVEVFRMLFDKKNQKLVQLYKSGSYQPTGYDYEHYLAYELKKVGYNAYVTRASGDFGTDVVVDINKYFRIIFQCKYYSEKVGNSAVQEICAAKEYYDAQLCVVITNQSYTDAAVKLAVVNKILLISNFDIGDDVLRVCYSLGLIPNKYIMETQLQLNDLECEKLDLIWKIENLEKEILEYKCNYLEIEDKYNFE